MFAGLDGRDIGWDCMVLKLLRRSLVAVRYFTTFTGWTNFMHNFTSSYSHTTGWLSCWLDHNFKGRLRYFVRQMYLA